MASQKHILMVDDDPLILEILRLMLPHDYRATEAHSVAEAATSLDSTQFDLVLTDYLLSDGRGTTLLALAKQLGVPALLMTGYPNEVAAEQLERKPLIKPFVMDALLAEIERATESPTNRIF
jgi:DNA-binding NtrC family response regulator